MDEHGSLPRARQDGLLVETVGEELLLYDQDSHTAHCLSPIMACVWRHCDGERDATELAEFARVSENLVTDALHQLRQKDLLTDGPQLMQSAAPGTSRREAIVQGLRYGAAAAAVPLIISATAATPAMASSGASCTTTTNNESCCLCKNNNTCITTKPTTNEAECIKNCEHEGGVMQYLEKAHC